jgi:hypothetical protein
MMAATTAGGIIVPSLLRSSPSPGSGGTPALPYVYLQNYYGLVIAPDGSYTIPPGFPVGYHAINEVQIGGTSTLYPAQPMGGTVPAIYQQAFDNWAQNNPPAGFSAATPQIAIMEILLGVAVIAGGTYVCYKLWKWASQLPPPDTNVYR